MNFSAAPPPSVPRVIAIDGPAASGKSSVARRVASSLGWTYANTGAMYRAVTMAVLEAGIDPSDERAIADRLESIHLQMEPKGKGEIQVRLEGEVVPPEKLTTPEVNDAVSLVAKVREVRSKLVALQQSLAFHGEVVLEGRDIGTVVCPDAPLKIFLQANESIRENRRAAQGLTDKIKDRDRIDASREESPLAAASDAVVLDTSDLTLEQVVAKVLDRATGIFALESPAIDEAKAADGATTTANRGPLLYRFCRGAMKLFFDSFYHIEVIGQENILESGPALITSNHVSFFDPPLIGTRFQNVIHYLARKTLFSNPFNDWLLRSLHSIPVDQEKADFTSLKIVIRRLMAGERVLIFPEGSRSWDGVPLPAGAGVGLVIAKTGVPILPVRLSVCMKCSHAALFSQKSEVKS
jgi:CMP/dCMP kinase